MQGEFAGNFKVRLVNYFVELQHIRNKSGKRKLGEEKVEGFFFSYVPYLFKGYYSDI